MARLPKLSGRQVVRTFQRLGWEEVRQSGSHIILTKPDHIATLSVPKHREVAVGTLRSLIRSAGIDVDEFTDAMK